MYGGWAAFEGIDRAFPLPYVMYFTGYLMILAIDRVIARDYHVHQHHGCDPKLEDDGATWDKEQIKALKKDCASHCETDG